MRQKLPESSRSSLVYWLQRKSEGTEETKGKRVKKEEEGTSWWISVLCQLVYLPVAGSNTVCLVVPTLCVLVKVLASGICLLHDSQDAKDLRWNQGPSNSFKGTLPITYEAPLDKGSNTSQEYQGLGLILLLMRLQHFRSKLK